MPDGDLAAGVEALHPDDIDTGLLDECDRSGGNQARPDHAAANQQGSDRVGGQADS